jgi:hypothetical protein
VPDWKEFMMRIDHVIIGARRVEPVRDLLWQAHGFGLVRGSAHADGTAGWLVPFNTPEAQYLEVLVPHDQARLAADRFGRYFLDATAAGPVFLAWAVHTGQIERDAARVGGLTGADPQLLRGESVRADGTRSPWAEAAFELAWTMPSRPFFLRYGNWAARAARVPQDLVKAGHRVTPLAYESVSVDATTANDLDAWCGGADLAVSRHTAERDAIRSARVRTEQGSIEVTLPC